MSQYARMNPDERPRHHTTPIGIGGSFRDYEEPESEPELPEPEPVVEAIRAAQNELLNECAKGALDEC